MYKRSLILLFTAFLLTYSFSQAPDAHTLFIKNIYEESLTARNTNTVLQQLCQKFPRRLSGSNGLEDAVQWTKSLMEGYDFDNVFLQEVMVPHWERGEKESAYFYNSKGKKEHLSILALGRSIATPVAGISAQIIQVGSLQEIAQLGKEKIQGKIVYINKPFEQHFIRTFEGYTETVKIRTRGPSEAAKYGAVACVIRSVGTADDDYAHTGSLLYAANVPQIPAAALSVKSAKKLESALQHNPQSQLYLKINSKTLPDKMSHNVIGEIKGSEKPEKIIVIGGHLDAWDVGQGAHDDGAGCMQSVMALRMLQQMGYKPNNTLRVVLFTNEENGTKGGKKYAEYAFKNKEDHIFALESDAGAFTPRAIGINGPDSLVQKVKNWIKYFPDFTIDKIIKGKGGSDVEPLHKEMDTPVGSLMPDSQRYFDFHHTHADVFEAVNARELEMGTASMASFIYLVDQLGF